jgi:hypothetical protein
MRYNPTLFHKIDPDNIEDYIASGYIQIKGDSKMLRLATIWLDGCSGCHMSFLDMNEKLLEIAPFFDVVYSPLVDQKNKKKFKTVIDPLTRIEGHAKITIDLDESGAVSDAKLHVTQFRGFEKFCEGRLYS